jgi:hypothetical protein
MNVKGITIMRNLRTGLIARILVVTLAAATLSACAATNDTMPQFSKADVASGRPLPQGILPNGIVTEPWFG